MQNFEDWLKERQKGINNVLSEKLQGKTKIHIFDFDSTLFGTHTREEGESILHSMGQKWNHKGWWGRPETLEEPLASHIKPNEQVAKAFRASKSDPESLTILMTGRHDDTMKKDKTTGQYKVQNNPRIVPNIHSLLKKHGLIPDFDLYKTGGASTYEYKANMLRKILHAQPAIKELHMWDDRHDHVWGGQGDEGFIQLLRKLKQEFNLTNVAMHHVVKGQISSHEI